MLWHNGEAVILELIAPCVVVVSCIFLYASRTIGEAAGYLLQLARAAESFLRPLFSVRAS